MTTTILSSVSESIVLLPCSFLCFSSVFSLLVEAYFLSRVQARNTKAIAMSPKTNPSPP
ncbi:hypothetical protein LguiA_027992 [Lonicera macranthoides]